jgi:hypothetical protein
MSAAAMRLFRVHARQFDHPQAHLVSEASFEAAAVAYLEGWPHAGLDDSTISLVVRDLATGDEHCFRLDLDLDTGATAPCD